jgi:site-specific recombinase XerD
MNTTELMRVSNFEPVIRLVVDSLTSPHSQRAYERALTDFCTWYDSQGRPGLKKAIVNQYKAQLVSVGLAPSTINQRLSAIRKLATEAADNGYFDPNLAAGIGRVQGVSNGGRQAQALLNAPDPSTLKGLRDRAILAVLLGGALRRAECARLNMEHFQQREGRWVILDLVGKRNKRRTVPIPSWVKVAVDAWTEAAGIETGRVFRPVAKGGRRITGETLTPQAIRNLVKHYARRLGLGELSPHDLRRTWAKLAHKGGAALEQIQLSLGHASIKTTEVYLGIEQDLTCAPCDFLGLRI